MCYVWLEMGSMTMATVVEGFLIHLTGDDLEYGLRLVTLSGTLNCCQSTCMHQSNPEYSLLRRLVTTIKGFLTIHMVTYPNPFYLLLETPASCIHRAYQFS